MAILDQATIVKPGTDTDAPAPAHVYKDAAPAKPGAGHPSAADLARATETHVKGGVLPSIHIHGTDTHPPVAKPADTHAPAPKPADQHNFAPPAKPADTRPAAAAPAAEHPLDFLETAGAVASDVASGAWDELTNHTGDVLKAAGTGLAVGLGTLALAAVAPEAAVVVGGAALVAGVAVGGYELATHVGGWVHDASVISDPTTSSAADVANAHADLQGVGRGATLMAATLAGGAAAPAVADGIVAMTTGTAVDSFGTAVSNIRGVFSPADGASPPIDGVPPPQVNPVAPLSDAAPQATVSGATIPDAAAPAPIGDVVPVKAPLDTPAPVEAPPPTVEDTQNLFRSQADDGGLVPSVKRTDYNVTFTRAPEGTLVKSIESVKAGTDGELTGPGDWIATRLNPDGTVNQELGVNNSWAIGGSKIAAKYQIDPADLETSDTITAAPRPGGMVHMVQLPEDTTIMTGRGPLAGYKGDWLANYDYNPATNTPGSDFAIVSKPSYEATYTPVTPS